MTTQERQQTIDELNQLTERKCDLQAEIQELDLARDALFTRLREVPLGTQTTIQNY